MRVFAYCQNCTIAKPDIGGPQLRHRAAFLHPGSNAFRYSKKVIAALPQEKFVSYRLLHEFRNFSVKPRWCPIVKHRQNVRKRLFHKLTMEMPIEVIPWTALGHFIRVCCEFFSQFQRLVRTKIWPSSIIIR